ncbi:MAG: hypothetical protein K2J29_10645, partial [Muribaculaceae bacterium]|nr:hypothetical protein [Muribaculaceae bacterium]
MEGNRTKIVKNSFFLYLRMGIIMVISLFSVRLLLNALQVNNYGVYNAIGGVVTSFAFITTVLSGACQRYFSYSIGKKDFIQLNKDLGSIILVYITIIIIFISLSESLGIWFI